MRCTLDRCRQGQFDVTSKCQCDPDCALYGDCCYDYESTCKDSYRTLALQLTGRTMESRINASCSRVFRSPVRNTFWMVDNCPEGTEVLINRLVLSKFLRDNFFDSKELVRLEPGPVLI